MTTKISASIQARMGSSRLPGKVLADICGKPMLFRQIERIKKSRLIDELIVATSNSPKDDKIELFCSENNIKIFRGSENDVLGRICEMIEKNSIENHVEFYGDSPLPDSQIIDEIIGLFLKFKDQADYFSSSIKTTYPPGLEVSVYSSKILLEVNKLIEKNDPLREHVGYNITRFPDKFKQFSIAAPQWFHYPDIYLEVDTKSDLNLIRKIYEYFIIRNIESFQLKDILDFLKMYPDLIEINNKENRRWKSFRKE